MNPTTFFKTVSYWVPRTERKWYTKFHCYTFSVFSEITVKLEKNLVLSMNSMNMPKYRYAKLLFKHVSCPCKVLDAFIAKYSLMELQINIFPNVLEKNIRSYFIKIYSKHTILIDYTLGLEWVQYSLYDRFSQAFNSLSCRKKEKQQNTNKHTCTTLYYNLCNKSQLRQQQKIHFQQAWL